MLMKIKNWYDGEVKTYNDPHIIGFYIERHWTSDAAHAIVDFYLVNWKWLWGFGATMIGLYIAYLGLSKGS